MASTTTNDPWTLPELTRARRAIVVVDVVESVRLMQEDEAGFIERWRRFVHQVRHEVLPKHGGRMVKSLGDGMLLEFERVPAAVAACFALQRSAPAVGHSAHVPIALRIGIHICDISIDEFDVLGSGVNMAARVAGVASAGAIVVTADARDLLVDGLDADIEDLGERFVKHFELPIRLYAVAPLDGSMAVTLPAPSHPRWPAIAVVPLRCQDASDARHTLGEVLCGELVARLVQVPTLHVISTMSTRGLRDRALAANELAQRLAADYVVAGQYAVQSSRVRFFVELTLAREERLLWADSVTVDTGDLQTSMVAAAQHVGDAIQQGLLRHAMARSRSMPLQQIDSYTLFFAAIALMHRASSDAFERARLMLEELTWRHGRSPLGHAWLAKWHVLRVVQGWSKDPQNEGQHALDRAYRAIDADADDSLALSIAGLVHGYLRKDLATAGRCYDAALCANPSEPLAWLFKATWHSYNELGLQAEEASERALRLSPLDPMKYFFDSLAATAVLSNGSFARSISLSQRSLKANRRHASTWRTLAIAQALSGDLDAARATVGELRLVEPDLTAARFLERYPGRDAPHAARYAQALVDAGLPR
jgi:class 3 adenylate cyclase/TolB-like protein